MNTIEPQFDELGRLAAALCEGELTADEAPRLESLVATSADARRSFLNYMLLHGELYWEHAASAGVDRGAEGNAPVDAAATVAASPRTSLTNRLRRLARPVAWVAALSAALLVGAIGWRAATSGRATEAVVARVVSLADARWEDGWTLAADDALRAGQLIRLQAGRAEIGFAGGASVIVQGPCRFGPLDERSARCDRGNLTVTAAGPAAGFRLQTPTATIVDLGTRFGVVVEPSGVSEVHVFDGRVEVRESDAIVSQPRAALRRRLVAGEAVRVWTDSDGQAALATIPHEVGKFVQSLPPSPRLAGSAAALRRLVAADPRLRHHYTFEGATPAERLADRRGGLDLHPVVMWAGGGGTVQYDVAGVDGTTAAVAPFRAGGDDNTRGAGLVSQGEFAPPPQFTVEMLLRFAGFHSDREGLVGTLLATRQGETDCFFVAAVDRGHLVHLFRADAPWVQTNVELNPGDWYYVACTFRSSAGQTRINSFVANVSRGDCALQWVVRDEVTPGEPAASRLGVGKGFSDVGAHAYPWAGAIDEVAIYGSALPRAVLQEHLGALVGPAAVDGGDAEAELPSALKR